MSARRVRSTSASTPRRAKACECHPGDSRGAHADSDGRGHARVSPTTPTAPCAAFSTRSKVPRHPPRGHLDQARRGRRRVLLDDEGSALSRLVSKVYCASRSITAGAHTRRRDLGAVPTREVDERHARGDRQQLTLDDEKSPLHRLRRELVTVLERQHEEHDRVLRQLVEGVTALTTRREAEARSTAHGHTFEEATVEWLARRSAQYGDILEATGHKVGTVRNCKRGDAVIEIGPGSRAAGARVVVEAKDQEKYTVRQAREYMDTARTNRQASVGLFVFSKQTAPESDSPMRRIGSDVFCIWDAEDSATDVILEAGLSVARALVEAAHGDDETKATLALIDKAIAEIERRTNNLQQVQKLAETIGKNADKILDRIRIDREALVESVAELTDAVGGLRGAA